jgi:hypothetical protein
MLFNIYPVGTYSSELSDALALALVLYNGNILNMKCRIWNQESKYFECM